MPGGQNVPIGNYTSQWIGNLYLNELDTYVKQVLGVRDYIRYCDDFLLFHDDKKQLGEWAEAVQHFCAERLKLRLSKCDLFPSSRGVDFLGYRHFPAGYLLLRKSTAKRMQRRVRALPWELRHGKTTKERALSSVMSMKGWMRWANTHHLALSMKLDELDRTSKFASSNAPRYLKIHCEKDGARHIVFTGSTILCSQAEKYADEVPFVATIKKIDKYYSFT